MRLIDLTGQRFGKLLVLERDFEYQKKNNYDKPYWKCICDCGNNDDIEQFVNKIDFSEVRK